ncbi:hypothetical protein NLU13_8096 [Sarocladium strictum]|uniref:DNA ligase D 3'-phosphoesterase domain-containing protein n=1 Tax=Sarocladium strictum TaxID=5046 RepID=A0AA39GB06_SARSR|nr:hypothetical protein NLU13_8096 [Sarocladium strictum]
MSKRPQSPDLIPNPFIKKRNLTWTLDDSPTRQEHRDSVHNRPQDKTRNDTKDSFNGPERPRPPPSAAIEAGQISISNHLGHFTAHLASHILQPSPLSVQAYSKLYSSSIGNRRGAHFVIHQHDHPVAGTHYDLRLQINETSSASWAIMYGMPGDVNSKRLNRNATETRIHCLWNHLVETASASTGSLIIWDTGTYTILPRTSKYAPAPDPSSPSSSASPSPSSSPPTQQELLHGAFQSRKIRLRLHGSKLPDPYVLNLRLTKPEDAQGRLRSSRVPRSRRRRGLKAKAAEPETSSSSGGESEPDDEPENDEPEQIGHQGGVQDGIQDPHITSLTERELLELEDHQVRLTNAYPGATNSIGSIHQRRWYLSVDRAASGFLKKKGSSRWELVENAEHTSLKGQKPDDGTRESETVGRLRWPFYVRGANHERSVVTGRKGEDVLRDEGVVGFVQRKGWKPVLS